MLLRSLLFFWLFFGALSGADFLRVSEVQTAAPAAVSVLARSQTAVVDRNGAMPPVSAFGPAGTSVVNLGFTDRTVWSCFGLRNDTAQTAYLSLVPTNPLLDRVTLYRWERGRAVRVSERGVMVSQAMEDGIIRPRFRLSLPPETARRYCLRVHSEASALSFGLDLTTDEAFTADAVAWQMLMSLFFGAMGALILYNFFIFVFTRDRAYLYYVFYHVFAVVNYLSYTCFTNYLLPVQWWETEARLNVFYQGAAALSALLFVRTFLKTARHPRIDAVFRVLIGVSALMAAAGLLPGVYPIQLSTLTGLGILLFALGVSVYLWRQGERSAKLLTAGWSAAVFGWVSLGLYDMGLVGPRDVFPYVYEAAMFAEALLFSVALASKLNLTERLRRSLESNRLLLRELNHRVKNNMQFIVSLYRLKLDLPGCPEVRGRLAEAEGAVQAMRTAHEMLYAGDEAEETVAMRPYLTTLAQMLERHRPGGRIEVRCDGDLRLPPDGAIRVGMLVNELAANAFKHAFGDGGGTARLSLRRENGKYRLDFRDDGGGCGGTEPDENGFGSDLMEMIAREELGGTITRTSEDGCRYTLVWGKWAS